MIRKYILLISTLTLSLSSSALIRTPVFPGPILFHHSATNWYAQNFVFDSEFGRDKKRPIWVLGGDSISAAWSSNSSLRMRYESAYQGELPIPNTIKDLLTHIPSSKTNWYSGSENDYGLLGYLDPNWAKDKDERKNKKPKWVIVATAFAGAMLMPGLHSRDFFDRRRFQYGAEGFFDHDTSELFKKVRHKDRVELVTFSLGSNDVCDGLDVFQNETAIRNKLRKMKNTFSESNPNILLWRVPYVDEVYSGIRVALSRLPERTPEEFKAKVRTINYCKQAWERYCPAAFNPGRVHAQVDKLNAIYTEEMGEIFDAGIRLDHSGDVDEVLDRLSRDCFHPSSNSQKLIKARLIEYLDQNGYRL